MHKILSDAAYKKLFLNISPIFDSNRSYGYNP